MESPHDVLGVDRDASAEEVRRAYRRRVKEVHPDQGGSPLEFQLVTAAYEQLRAGDGREPDDGLAEPTAGATRDRRGAEVRWPPRTGRSERPGRADDRPGTEARVEYLDYEVLDDYGWTIDDPALFGKAAEAGLDPADHGRFVVEADETLLDGAERCGFTWPYSCRGGACANCAVAVTDGELEMRLDNVLTDELVDDGVRLSCIGAPTTEELQVVFNVKHLPDVEDLLLPPGPFRRAQADD